MRRLALYGVVLVLLALPLFSVSVPPLADYPNHLARMHVLSAYAHSAALQAHYTVDWKLTPYLGMDLVVPPLAHLMPLYRAGQVFLLLCLALPVAGTAAIHAALFGRWSAWPAAGALFAYNYAFSLGFTNYMFGVGVWLPAFAGWIWLSRGPALRRVLPGAVLALLVFAVHYFAFLGYVLCIAGYELGVWLAQPERDARALLRRAAALGLGLLPALICAAFVPWGDGGDTVYGALRDKLTVLLSPTQFPGARLDLVILAFALLTGGIGLATGRLRLSPAMRLPLAGLGLAILAMPNLLMGVYGLDYRFPFVFLCLAIAGSRWSLPPRAATALMGAALLLLAANCAALVWAWRPFGAQAEELRAALPVIPQGARVVAFRDHDGIDRALMHGGAGTYFHLPLLAVIERDAYVPFLFKRPMMTVGAAAPNRAIDTPHGRPVELERFVAGADPVSGPLSLGTRDSEGRRDYWGGWPTHYDYAIELSFGAHPVLPPQLERVAAGSFFNIYRIRR